MGVNKTCNMLSALVEDSWKLGSDNPLPCQIVVDTVDNSLFSAKLVRILSNKLVFYTALMLNPL